MEYNQQLNVPSTNKLKSGIKIEHEKKNYEKENDIKIKNRG